MSQIRNRYYYPI